MNTAEITRSTLQVCVGCCLLICMSADQRVVGQGGGTIKRTNTSTPEPADPETETETDEAQDPQDQGGFRGGGRGRGGGGGQMNDPLAQRIAAAAAHLKAQGEYLLAQGEYANQMAEARQKIAEAVDLELDNWKKKVVIYFERQEENLRGRMRIRDLYDMKADQTLRLKDTAARRRYEYVTRHAGNTAGTDKNLNFLLDLFVGTPIGYGISIEEMFDGNPVHDRWRLTPDMLHQLRVRTKGNGGGWLEFRLDQPTPIAMDWPAFFRQPNLKYYRDTVESLNDQLALATGLEEQQSIIAQLDNAFAFLSRAFFQAYPQGPQRASLDSRDYRQLLRAEEFLAQKNREIQFLISNPESTIGVSRTFVPDIHGKDAGTLIAWMNARGMTFAKPLDGDETAYQRAFTMMHELYALSDAPVMDTMKTDLPVKPPPPEDAAEEEAVENALALPDIEA